MRRGIALAVLLVPFTASIPPVFADGPPKVYRFDAKGRVLAARAAPLERDRGAHLVLLVRGPDGTNAVTLKARNAAAGASWFEDADAVRFRCDGPDAGPAAEAGAVALVRDPPNMSGRTTWSLEFLGPHGVYGVPLEGGTARGLDRGRPKSLLARSAFEPLAFWDAVVDGWPAYPATDGTLALSAGTLDLKTADEVTRADTDLYGRDARVPSLRAADVDGDGTVDLVALVASDLVILRKPNAAGWWSETHRVPIPFLARDPKLPAEEIRTPRLSIADVDADGKADLLVTLVQGRADKPGGLRTSLYRFPGPFFDEKTGALVEPQSRLDTESVALHASFTDVDGDGRLDYVADSIRGNVPDLIARIMGREPTTWYTVFRFDPEKKAFERKPWAAVERPYSSEEAKGNRFGRSGWIDGDFDGDGVKDLLDLGNLKSVTILAGTKSGEGAFTREILPKTSFEKPLATDAVIADLDGDGVSDAALWNEDGLILIVSGKSK